MLFIASRAKLFEKLHAIITRSKRFPCSFSTRFTAFPEEWESVMVTYCDITAENQNGGAGPDVHF
jgi:hypothetical protein